MREYLPLVLLAGFIVLNAVAIIVASHVLSPTRPTLVKAAPYESGMPPLGRARERFSVKFYLIAMLFIIFDIEIIFLYPWAVIYRSLGWFGFWEMVAFLGVLSLGLGYVWRKGGLEWE